MQRVIPVQAGTAWEYSATSTGADTATLVAADANKKFVVDFLHVFLAADAAALQTVILKSGATVLWQGYFDDAAKAGSAIGFALPDGLVHGFNEAITVVTTGGCAQWINAKGRALP